MRNSSLISIIGLVAAFILILVCMMRISQLKTSQEELRKTIDRMYAEGVPSSQPYKQEQEEEEEVEVALYMTHIQRHMDKLYFAGKNEHWELAAFYTHEVEEMMEELEKHNVVEDDGIKISPLLKAMGLTPLEYLEESIEKKDKKEFLNLYTNQVQQCNACHTAAGYSFIKIKEPDNPAFTNQIYKP